MLCSIGTGKLDRISTKCTSRKNTQSQVETPKGNNFGFGEQMQGDAPQNQMILSSDLCEPMPNMSGLQILNSLPKEVTNVYTVRDVGTGLTDDNFFHLTCHVDSAIIAKIEWGEFVDLERLLVKNRGDKQEGRMEWVHREGSTFLVPAQHDIKINSVHHWEQAFRVYATIYCGANPHHEKEIWQYVSVINTAAASYSWDNVSAYDSGI